MNRLQTLEFSRLADLLSIRVVLWLGSLAVLVGGLGWYLTADSIYLLMAVLGGLTGFAGWFGLHRLRQSRLLETDRSRSLAVDAWQDPEQRYRRMSRMIEEVYCEIGMDGLIGEISPSIEPLTGYRRDELLGTAFETLAADTVAWRRLTDELLKHSKTVSHEINLRRQDNAQIPCFIKAELLLDPRDRPLAIIGTLRDLSERRLAEQEILQLAYHDALTGLPNRRLFKDRLEQALAQARRNNALLAILLLDLDHFKDVNETFSHSVGDRLLKIVAKRLSACIRKSDTVARLGGDEFVILLNAVNSDQNVSHVAEKILTDIAETVVIDDSEILTTSSLGVVLFPHDGGEAETLLKHADMAMYEAKEKGRNNYQFFSDEMNRQAIDRHQLEFKLRRALEREELTLNYQPQWDMQARRLVGLEALLRWTTEADGMIPPSRFIPVAEDTGLIRPIGEWVLLTACRQLKAWQQMGFADLRVAVNISARQFRQPDLVSKIDRILAETGLDAQFLELELTESYLMEDAHAAIRTLEFLKVRGIQLAIDDFGTGYSSLNYLKNFPIDRIKIDQSFVRDVTSNHDDAAIVGAIIAMAQSLDLDLVAEGVEGSEQLKFLLGHNCFTMQGYFFARPMPAAEMQLYLQDCYRRQVNPGPPGEGGSGGRQASVGAAPDPDF